MVRTWLISLAAVLAFTGLSAQPWKIPELADQKMVVVPFTYSNGFIIVDVIFQKVIPLKFILDTGAENSILLKREYAEVLNLEYQRKIKLLGTDLSRELTAYICTNTFMQFFNSTPKKHNIIVLDQDFFSIEEIVGSRVDGILGAEFFKNTILKIDYGKSQITIIDPEKFKKNMVKNYHSFDVELISGKPYLKCTTEVNPGSPVNARLLIDTGAGLTALLHYNTDTLLNYKGNIIKGSLGKGLGGDIEGYMGKIHKLSFGPLYFVGVISSFQALDNSVISHDKIVRNGLIGNILLERFDLFIDFRNSKLYVKPKRNYNKEFVYDRSGMLIFAFGKNLDSYYVKHVTENSPASEAGIQVGDVIQKIGLLSYKWFSLKHLNKILSGKPGKKIKLKLQRGNEIITKEIILKDLF